MERESMVFYKSWLEAIMNLPREVQADVLTAVIEYGLYGETTGSLKPITKAMLAIIKPQINANNAKYVNGCKGSEYGKLGGRPSKKKNGTLDFTPENIRENSVERPRENPLQQPREKPQENPVGPPYDNVNANDNENATIPPVIPPPEEPDLPKEEVGFPPKGPGFPKEEVGFPPKGFGFPKDRPGFPEEGLDFPKEKLKRSRKPKIEFIPPTLEEVLNFFSGSLLADWETQGQLFFSHYQSQGWKKGTGVQVTEWDSLANKWILDEKIKRNGKNTTNLGIYPTAGNNYDDA